MVYIFDSENGYGSSPYLSRWGELAELFTKQGVQCQVVPIRYGRPPDSYSHQNAYDIIATSAAAVNVATNLAKSGDILLFTQAWKVPQYVLWYINSMLNKQIKVYTIWYNDPVITFSESWGHFWGHDKRISPLGYHLAEVFVGSIKNIFNKQSDHNRLVQYITHTNKDSAVVCKYPSINQVENYNNNYANVAKQDRIIVPYRITPNSSDPILRSIAIDLRTKYEVVLCDYSKLTREQYYEYLAGSKIMLSANTFGNSMYEVYEALSFGVFPLVPTNCGFDNLPQRYYYSKEYIKANKTIRVVRTRDFLYRLFDDVKDSLDLSHLQQDAQEVYNKFFDTQQFLSILKE